MPYYPRSTTPSRGNNSSSDQVSDDLSNSPYVEYVDQTFTIERDVPLPDRYLTASSNSSRTSPALANNNSYGGSAAAVAGDSGGTGSGNSTLASTTPRSSNQERTLSTFFNRGTNSGAGSKDTLAPERTPSPTHRALDQQRNQRLTQDVVAAALAAGPPVFPDQSLQRTSDASSSSSLSTSVSAAASKSNNPKAGQGRGIIGNNYSNAPIVPKNTRPSPNYPQQPQQQQQQFIVPTASYPQPRPVGNTNDYLPPTAATGLHAGLVRPASPFAMAQSYNGSSTEGKEQTNSMSSTHRSSRNLSPGMDQNYNLTQTDLTLEGLAQRWQAYQAMMKKHYAENPFYKRWTRSKWMLLFSTLLLLGYSVTALVFCLGYIFDKFELAAVVMEFHSTLIYLGCAASALGILSALIGLVGVIREDRKWLSFYAFILWPGFALYVSVGYIAFRRANSHLRAHVKNEWIYDYTREQRLVVQRDLKCCGYQGPTWFAEYDARCFPMTNLPGCQHKYNLYEEDLLSKFSTIAFSLVPFHLLVMLVSLLCSNHIDGMLRSARPGLKSFKEEKKDN